MIGVDEGCITARDAVVYILPDGEFDAEARAAFILLARKAPNLALESGWMEDYQRGHPMRYLMVQEADGHAGQYRAVFWGQVMRYRESSPGIMKYLPTRRDAILITLTGDEGLEERLASALKTHQYVDLSESKSFVPNYGQPGTTYYSIVLKSYGQVWTAQARMRIDEILARLTL